MEREDVTICSDTIHPSLQECITVSYRGDRVRVYAQLFEKFLTNPLFVAGINLDAAQVKELAEALVGAEDG